MPPERQEDLGPIRQLRSLCTRLQTPTMGIVAIEPIQFRGFDVSLTIQFSVACS